MGKEEDVEGVRVAIEVLGEEIVKLQKILHHETCTRIEQCPTLHPLCSQRLGLHTVLVYKINLFYINLATYLDTKEMVAPTERVLESYLTKFRTIYGILVIHLGYHEVYKTKETKILRRLAESISFVVEMVSRIECD